MSGMRPPDPDREDASNRPDASGTRSSRSRETRPRVSAPEDERRSTLTDAAGRAALFPARAAARVWRDQLEAAVDEVLSAPEIARVIDRALAGSLPEQIARSVVRHRVLERVVAELAASGEFERLLNAALASPRTLELTDRMLASDETQHALRNIASSPAILDAIERQTAGLAEEVISGIRAAAVRSDDRAEQAVRRRPQPRRSSYAGIATRALALTADVLVTTFIYMAIVGVVAIISSLVGGLGSGRLVGSLLGVGWTLLAGSYFVLFWSSAGHTPGMRLFRLHIQTAGAEIPSVGRSIVRLIGLLVSIAIFFLGFVPVLFDEQRRGLADFVAGTRIVYDDVPGAG
jgi:uncharacterized RDD family membrane protein YckC